MKSFVTLATLLSLAQSIVALTINTPSNVVSCQPTLLTWSDGQAPFFLSIIPGGQVSAPALKTFPTQNGNQLTWTVDIQPNTGITISLKDSTGAQAYSDIVTITGTDRSCENSSSGSSDANASTAAAGADSGAPSGTTAVAGATTGAATTGGAAPTSANSNAASVSKTTPATSAASPTKTSGSAASSQSNAASKSDIGALGIAGVMALVGLAVA